MKAEIEKILDELVKNCNYRHNVSPNNYLIYKKESLETATSFLATPTFSGEKKECEPKYIHEYKDELFIANGIDKKFNLNPAEPKPKDRIEEFKFQFGGIFHPHDQLVDKINEVIKCVNRHINKES